MKNNAYNISISYSILGFNALGEYLLEGLIAIDQMILYLSTMGIIINKELTIEFFADASIVYRYKTIEDLVDGFIEKQRIPVKAKLLNKNQNDLVKEKITKLYYKKTISLNLINYINNKIWPFIVRKFIEKNIRVSSYIKNDIDHNINICTFTVLEDVIKNIYNTNFSEASDMFLREFLEWTIYNGLRVNKIEILEQKILVQM